MAEKSIQEQLKSFANKSLVQRSQWYAPIAEAYDRVRPRYPREICDRILDLAQLPPDAQLLEIGCGPGTATVNFAQSGHRIHCLEPNPAFCELARQNLAGYPQVTVENIALEDWSIAEKQFDLVYAANAFHWIPPEVGYPRVAAALKPSGKLALIWNMTLEPSRNMYKQLCSTFETYVPALARYEGSERQAEILQELGQGMLNSGFFAKPIIESIRCENTYSHEDFLALLSTYSPYIALPSAQRDSLVTALRRAMKTLDDGGQIKLFNRCGFQIAGLKLY